MVPIFCRCACHIFCEAWSSRVQELCCFLEVSIYKEKVCVLSQLRCFSIMENHWSLNCKVNSLTDSVNWKQVEGCSAKRDNWCFNTVIVGEPEFLLYWCIHYVRLLEYLRFWTRIVNHTLESTTYIFLSRQRFVSQKCSLNTCTHTLMSTFLNESLS